MKNAKQHWEIIRPKVTASPMGPATRAWYELGSQELCAEIGGMVVRIKLSAFPDHCWRSRSPFVAVALWDQGNQLAFHHRDGETSLFPVSIWRRGYIIRDDFPPEDDSPPTGRELIEASLKWPWNREARRRARSAGKTRSAHMSLHQEDLIAARQDRVLHALEIHFGVAPYVIRERIEAIQDKARLQSLHKSVKQALSIDEFTRML
jgi:hypothetical protein